MNGSASHLFHRFFDVLLAQPLSKAEGDWVRSRLSPSLASLFFDQPYADQRHAYTAAQLVIEEGLGDDVVVAALTHDVAKRHSRLGVIGRSVASIMMGIGLRLGHRMASYRDHGRIGARELSEAGAPFLAIEFARHHQGARPATIPPNVWAVLAAADQPPKASASVRRWITSLR